MSCLVIRADADSSIGGGHLMRCLALAQEWKEQGGRAVFLSHCVGEGLRARIIAEKMEFVPVDRPYPSPADLPFTISEAQRLKEREELDSPLWLAVDGYHFDTTYHKAIRDAGINLLVIDDTAHLPHYHADVLLNQNINADFLTYRCDADTFKLLGPGYALLRREFLPWRTWKREIPGRATKMLVTLGAADPNNVTLKVVKALQLLDADNLEARIVIGPANPYGEMIERVARKSGGRFRIVKDAKNMPELMAWADAAVSGAGSTCWELAFMWLPSLLIPLADNQQGIASALGEEMQVALRLREPESATPEHVAGMLHHLLHDALLRETLSTSLGLLVDGQGAQRCVTSLQSRSLPSDNDVLQLRPATRGDAFMLWRWANDPLVRQNSFSQQPIPWHTHVMWFTEKLKAGTPVIWIVERHHRNPIGQVRFDAIDKLTARVSYSLSSDFRGMGYGPKLLELACGIGRQRLGLRYLEGVVQAHNVPSIKSFIKAGFVRVHDSVHSEKDGIVFQRELCDG